MSATPAAWRLPATVPALPGKARVERLDNGLTVCLVANPQAPLVSTCLWYRAGTRDEEAGHGGAAHFLEHMMFKGSERYAPGEIDRRTQALGGVNNAFTGHDATAYYFNFARDRWREALAIEADRMTALTLDEAEVASERQVILEEIAMVESDPWDTLEKEVHGELFAGHPYALPVLGTAPQLKVTGAEALGRFHRRFYKPDNAVMVVAGDLGAGALGAVKEAFEDLPLGSESRPEAAPARLPAGLVRVERRMGEVPRFLLALPAPPAGSDAGEDHPLLRLLLTVLAGGRASRLQRRLVDELQLCPWISAQVNESLDPGVISVAAELVPGGEPEVLEEKLCEELEAIRQAPPAEEEMDRAKNILAADWVFGHERIDQQALSAGSALTFFDDLTFRERRLETLLAAGREELQRVAEEWLDPERGAILGWSLPSSKP